MNFIALRMLTGDRAKYFGLVFAIAFCTFLLENQTSVFTNVLKRTASQILDVTDAEVWVMDPKTEYWEQTKALKDTDLTRVRSVPGVAVGRPALQGNPVAKTLDGKFAASFLIGLDDATLAGAPRKMLMGSWERLREPHSVVVDEAGYILLYPGEPLELGRTLEMNDHRVTIVGISDASAPFVSLPVMHARYSEAVDFLGRERTQLSFVIARAAEGHEPRGADAPDRGADRPARPHHERVHVGLHPLLHEEHGHPDQFRDHDRGGAGRRHGRRRPDLLPVHAREPPAVRRAEGDRRHQRPPDRDDPAAGRLPRRASASPWGRPWRPRSSRSRSTSWRSAASC